MSLWKKTGGKRKRGGWKERGKKKRGRKRRKAGAGKEARLGEDIGDRVDDNVRNPPKPSETLQTDR